MRRGSWAAWAAAAGGLLLTACAATGTGAGGGAAKPSVSASAGPNIAALRSGIVAAMGQAKSVKVKGSAFQGSQQVRLDVVITRAGPLGGRIAIGGHWVRLLTTRRHVYVYVTKSMARWQKFPPGACAVMCGKWLQESAGELRSVAGDVNWAKMVGTFQLPISGESVHYAGTATVGGQPALKLSFPGDGTVYVAAHGTPYPLQVSAGANQLSFTDWNTAKLPPLPPASKVMTASQLAAGG